MMSDSCFICDKHSGKIPHFWQSNIENEFLYVGHIDKKGPLNYLGHIMIDLKRHVASLTDMTMEEDV